jgi:hypothetical protein
VKAFIQTRGRNVDYAFLGDAPKDRWWSQYRDLTSFEDPTIIVQSSNNKWHVFLSGIGSNRKDRVGTSIRYSIVLEGSCGVQQAAIVVNVIGLCIESAAANRALGHIQEALDAGFPEALVESVFLDKNPQSACKVDKMLIQVLNGLPTMSVDNLQYSEIDSWLGRVDQPKHRSNFIGQVKALLGGQNGRALFLNLLKGDDARKLVEQWNETTAILIEDDAAANDIIYLRNSEGSRRIQTATLTQPIHTAIPITKHIAISTLQEQESIFQPATNTQSRNQSLVFLIGGILLSVFVLWLIFKQSPELLIQQQATEYRPSDSKSSSHE